MAIRIKTRVGAQRTLDPSVRGYAQAITRQMKAIEKDLKAVLKDVKNLTPQALREGLQPVFDLSQKYVPVKTGKLKASGLFEVKAISGGAQAEISYGKGGNPPYAALQHENTEFFHEHPTRAKFLQAAFEEEFFNIPQRVAKVLARAVK